MIKNMVDIFNLAVPSAINKYGDFYKVLVGDPDFTPGATIVDSEDYSCGALCNELEFVRNQSSVVINDFNPSTALGSELEVLVNTFVDLPRRGVFETDDSLRNRFKFLVAQKTNYRRTTRQAILDAISYFMTDMTKVQLIELFDSSNLYFQIRFEGSESDIDAMFMDNIGDDAFIDQNYVGGSSIGYVRSFIGDLIARIKAAGVEWEILFIQQSSIEKYSNCTIGSVNINITSDAKVLNIISFDKTSDATITT